ncbi:MAG TPA: UDP-N-acetylmuramate dehydrogenase [Rhizomicrobium sp.]|nr:UDP-N-acetylmuramate dehydrogenase [Rhizomicrobium sp.]
MIRREGELRWLNSFRIESWASECVFPEAAEDLLGLDETFREAFVLGHGNNVILSRASYGKSTKFISMSRFDSEIEFHGTRTRVGAGASLRRLCIAAASRGLGGLERLWDIPSSVGGAIYMNAGAYDCDIHRVIRWVRIFDREKRLIRTFERSALVPGYRYSIFQGQPWIIVEAELELTESRVPDVLRMMREISIKRRKNFPYAFPNAGSVFKRPMTGLPVGKMVEQLGLKGTRRGGARISELHGGFIVSDGTATGCDIVYLANLIRSRVAQAFGMELEMEQVIV